MERWEILHLVEFSSAARSTGWYLQRFQTWHRQRRRARAARWAVVVRVTAVTLISNTNSRRFLPFSETLGGFPKTKGWPMLRGADPFPKNSGFGYFPKTLLRGNTHTHHVMTNGTGFPFCGFRPICLSLILIFLLIFLLASGSFDFFLPPPKLFTDGFLDMYRALFTYTGHTGQGTC